MGKLILIMLSLTCLSSCASLKNFISQENKTLLNQELALVEEPQNNYLLLLDTEPKHNYVEGEFMGEIETADQVLVLKKSLRNPPKKVSDWVGQTVLLFGEVDRSCQSTVKQVRLQGHLDKYDMESIGFDRHSPEFLRQAWQLSKVYLVAEVEQVAECAKVWPRYGRLASLPKPVLASSYKDYQYITDKALEEKVLKLYRSLPEYQIIQNEYERAVKKSVSNNKKSRSAFPVFWDELPEPWNSTQLIQVSNGKQLIKMNIDFRCTSGADLGPDIYFSSGLSAIWEVKDNNLVLNKTEKDGGSEPIIDLENDGIFETLPYAFPEWSYPQTCQC